MDNVTGLPWGQLIDDEGILVGVQIDDNGLGARLLTVRAIVPAAQVDRLLARAALRKEHDDRLL